MDKDTLKAEFSKKIMKGLGLGADSATVEYMLIVIDEIYEQHHKKKSQRNSKQITEG